MNNVQKSLGAVIGLLLILLAYLVLWPVPIDPVSWDAPVDVGLVDPFDANDSLRKAKVFDLGTHEGPEDVAGGPDGLIYAATAGGVIIRLRPDGNGVEVFAETGGRPLGIEFDPEGNLFVARDEWPRSAGCDCSSIPPESPEPAATVAGRARALSVGTKAQIAYD